MHGSISTIDFLTIDNNPLRPDHFLQLKPFREIFANVMKVDNHQYKPSTVK